MRTNPKLQIYKGIIQYLLESANYSLKDIADLSNSSIKNILSVYCDELIPSNFKSTEQRLVKLYDFAIEQT